MADSEPTLNRSALRALATSYRREVRAAALYDALSKRQTDERARGLFRRLADSERTHANRFAARIAAIGGEPPQVRDPIGAGDRVRLHLFGTHAMLRHMEAEEEKNIADFGRHSAELTSDPESHRLFLEVEHEEQAHAHLLQGITSPLQSSSRLDAMFRAEKWHVNTGTWIGDAIYGVNDGLGAVFGIVSGMAGYTGSGQHVVFSGLLATLASALSMGTSAFLAARAEREVHEAEIDRERKEIDESPEHEREELSLILQLKGFTEDEAARMVSTIASRPEQFLRTMAHEELGLSEDRLPNHWVSLLTATVSTAVGGIVPVLPFLVLRGTPALVWAAIVSMLAHFAVGAAKSIVTARNWFVSGLEMTAVGVIMGAVTYFLGAAFKLG